ncbi:purine-nucleoside phosphorylase [Leptobacterium flavescens]|uniref:Uridine phosphorylase n=1 Tax=Leptobacterium flavescens TaxID=472055 RepID=A0A6P0USY5_9FLAO|nr:purine-nucleoside phosphorylase [Leptobacterium flavescens]NER13963.1 purine-nucleoside phosphorylase [Leptobacterium flavescens]
MSNHIQAAPGEVADTVLMPGDPLRAKWIAENYLEDVHCYNEVRGMLGFTGNYKGKRVSVQGSGMGIPSALIYYNELIKDYGVKSIIRVGTAGSYQQEVKIRDLVLAMAASTNSSINRSRFAHADYCPTASFELLMKASLYAREKEISFKAGNVLSSDEFYDENSGSWKKWAEYGVLCVEMEAAGLYTIAAKYGIQALTILTISDSLVTGEKTSPEERETSFSEMIEMALHIAD